MVRPPRRSFPTVKGDVCKTITTVRRPASRDTENAGLWPPLACSEPQPPTPREEMEGGAAWVWVMGGSSPQLPCQVHRHWHQLARGQPGSPALHQSTPAGARGCAHHPTGPPTACLVTQITLMRSSLCLRVRGCLSPAWTAHWENLQGHLITESPGALALHSIPVRSSRSCLHHYRGQAPTSVEVTHHTKEVISMTPARHSLVTALTQIPGFLLHPTGRLP